jgi:peptidoglycan/LPS O-acetylase OafA/YrhL
LKRSYFHLIALIGIILGVALLEGGIYASTYSTRSGLPPAMVTFVYPYVAYSSILFGAGAVSIFIGIAAVFLAPQRKRAVIRVLIFLAFLLAETVVAFLTVHNGFNYLGFLAITLIILVLCIYSVLNYPTKLKTKNTLS